MCPHTSSHTSVLRPLRLGAIWDARSWRYLGVGHRQLGSLVNPVYSGGLRRAVLLELKRETKCGASKIGSFKDGWDSSPTQTLCRELAS